MVAQSSIVLALLSSTSATSWPEFPHVRFAISSAKVSACLDISDPSAWFGSLVQVIDCDPSQPGRRWFFRHGSIVHQTSSGLELCVEIPVKTDKSATNGQRLELSSCNGESQQKFRYKDGMLQAKVGGKCLDLRTEDDLAVQIWDCAPRAKTPKNQRWLLTMLPEESGPALTVEAKGSNRCLDLDQEADGASPRLWYCNAQGNAAQRWSFNGRRIVHSTAGGQDLCLDIPQNQRSNGQQLQVWNCTGSPQQQFVYQGGAIKTRDGNFCLDSWVEGAVQLWECDERAAQQWTLVPPTLV